MILLISYDLNGHERPSAYEEVRKVIENKATGWKKPLYSQWLVETEEDVDTWTEALRTAMDEDDKLFVVRVQRPYQGWLPENTWKWMSPKL